MLHDGDRARRQGRAVAMDVLFDLTGRAALVTGAGQGLGRAIAAGLAQHGAAVAVLDLDGARAAETAGALRDCGWVALSLVADVRRADQVELAVDTVLEQFGRLDILVNGAGITRRVPAEVFAEQEWREVVEVNLVGLWLCCQAAGRVMLRQRRGSIVNIASCAAAAGLGRGNTAYTASKGGVVALTRELAVEWAPHGIRVNALAPGYFRTPMTEALHQDAVQMERLTAAIPLGRFGEPEDLIGPAVFLAADASAMVTGHALFVDGGYTAR